MKPTRLQLTCAVLTCMGCLTTASFLSSSMEYFTSGPSESAVQNGMNKLNELTQKTGLPRYGECWTSALESLNVGCKMLSADMQSKLALAFTSCFVEMLGYPPYLCAESTPVQECIKNLDQRGYNTFLEYFLHTQDMCYYLSSQMWQTETERTVNELQNVAKGVSKVLEDSSKAQEQILKSQQETLKVQNDLVHNNTALYSAIVRVKQVFDGLSLTAQEHQVMFGEIFDKISKMQNLVSWIQGEMSLLDMFGFYFVALVLGFVASATKRTKDARFWLVILYTTTFMVERILNNIWLDPLNGISPEELQWRLWFIRRSACVAGFLIVVLTAATYQDFHKINNSSLQDVQDKLKLMNQKLETLAFVQRPERILQGIGGFPRPYVARLDYKDFLQSNLSDDSSESGDFLEDSESDDTSVSHDVDQSEMDLLFSDIEEVFPELAKENIPETSYSRDDSLSPKMGEGADTIQRYNLRLVGRNFES